MNLKLEKGTIIKTTNKVNNLFNKIKKRENLSRSELFNLILLDFVKYSDDFTPVFNFEKFDKTVYLEVDVKLWEEFRVVALRKNVSATLLAFLVLKHYVENYDKINDDGGVVF